LVCRREGQQGNLTFPISLWRRGEKNTLSSDFSSLKFDPPNLEWFKNPQKKILI
jgi:hypothetical protein